ncbi:PREDICTED: uncharacterized protein LOC108562919 [Nicrophorus vespilloides]|uniref:Uncharacterized protein LOC108562919 n=1 Tax=Nicrophorus vespilloides TaxID=110193 RepID=A0ABM1MQR7_NICVS|nr:PREDICTED: uncharacterized protein LOC108562919 [Nicrophorus vespilloides]
MASLKVSVALLFCMQIFAAAIAAGASVVTLTDYKTCKTDVKSYMSMDFKPGDKTFNVDIDTPAEVNKMFNFNIVIDKWTGTSWKKNIFSNTGQLCEYIEKSSDKFIDKLTQLSKPKIERKCPWKKGSYKIVKFPTVFNSKEYNFPTIIMGKFRVNVKVLKGKSVVACMVLEADAAMK